MSLHGFVITLAMLGGCYAPSIAEGLPCGTGGACPADQQCDLVTGRCVRMLGARGDATLDDDAAIDVPIDAPSGVFVDDFSRPNSATIGNGWIEKNPPVYAIANGEVARIGTPLQSYRDNLAYRPAAENIGDVDVSINVRFNQLPPRFAQIFVRGRTSSITAPDSYDGYLLFVNGNTTTDVVLGRQLGTVFVVTLSTIILTEPLNTTDAFRLSLRATGTMPVELRATVERLASGSWQLIGSTTASDGDPTRITEPGTVGFAGDEIAAYAYDEFRRTAP